MKEQHVGQELTDNEDEDDLPNDGDKEVIQQNHDEHVYHDKQPFPPCPGCKENANAINELKQEFVKLNEQLKKRDITPSYDDLLLRIKTLDEERDSLVTALRLLSDDVKDYVLIDRVGGPDGKIFGPRSWRTDRSQRGPCAMTEGQIFSRPARPNSVNKHFII